MKKLLITLALTVMILVAPVTRAEAATAKKPVVSSVVKKPKKTTIKFKKYSKNTIYYTTNGKTPKKGKSYTKKYSNKGIVLTSSKTVKAVSYVGKKKSKVFSKKYTVYPKPSMSTASLTLIVGKSKTIKVNKAKTSIKWSSNNTGIVTVSNKGKIKAKKAGTAIITAKVNGGKVTCKVTVKKENVTSKIDYDDDYVDDTLPIVHISTLTMDGKSIQLGENISKLVSLFGSPDRIDRTAEFDLETNRRITRYVYNSDPSRIVLFDVQNNKVTGWWTASPYASVDGFTPGLSKGASDESSDYCTAMFEKLYKPQQGECNENYSSAGYFFSDNASKSNIQLFADNYSTSQYYGKVVAIQSVLGEYATPRNLAGVYYQADDDDSKIMAIESMDVTNGLRYLHGRHAYAWDTKGYAEKEGRAHNTDMAVNNFFGHETTRFVNRGTRYGAAYCNVHETHPAYCYGLGCNIIAEKSGENCHMTSGANSIYSMIHGLYSSQGHREQLLSRVYLEYGAGYCTNPKGTKTYLTQEFVVYDE